MRPVKERPAYESPVDEGSRRMGLVAVAALGVIIAGVVILMAFSTINTPMSVDGDRATYSHNLDD